MITKATLSASPDHLTVADFRRLLERAGIRRGYVARAGTRLVVSHRELEPIADWIRASPAFRDHAAVFIGTAPGILIPFFAFIHRTTRGPAQGGLRLRRYHSLADVLHDGLRLSAGMTDKNAIAGLYWGGGKGILALPAWDDDFVGRDRWDALRAYGEFVADLNGVYYTAEDVGTTTADMDEILAVCRFVTCISTAKGGSGNPSPKTARGVRAAMKAAAQSRRGSDSLRGLHMAVQGVGNCGGSLVTLLIEEGARVTVCDSQEEAVHRVVEAHPGVEVVAPDAIYDVPCDIFAPCAVGGVLNMLTIARLKATIVVGAANNILDDEVKDARRLDDRGILYIPDFWANRMGIVNCCNEIFGADPVEVEQALACIYPDTLRLIDHAAAKGISTMRAAREFAEAAAATPHPLHPGRFERQLGGLLKRFKQHAADTELA